MNRLFGFLTINTLALLVVIPAYAATITLSPTTVSVVKGQNISMVIQVDPAGSKVYTVKNSISFPASLLEVASFTQSEGWVPLSMTGYDSVDNTSGTVIKTAGYPSGFSNIATFGTLVFRAKESGTATISVTNASFAYDAQSKNALSGAQGSAIVTITATATPAPTTITPTKTPTLSGTVKTPTSTPTPSAVMASATPEVSVVPLAAAAGTTFLGLGLAWYWWLIIVIVLLVIFWLWRRRK